MSTHRFVGIDRGKDGFRIDDFAFGTVDPAANTGAATSADDAVAAAQALQAAVTSAVSAAAANGTIAGDGPALALVQAIQTAFDLVIAANAAAKSATAGAVTAANAIATTLDATLKSVALVCDEVDAQGAPLNRMDIQKALDAFKRVYSSGPTFTTWPAM